jgi:putative copper resistance protein D
VAGVVFFIVGISEPALRDARDYAGGAFAVRNRLAWIAWISLAVTLLSGVPWLVLTAESMSGQPLGALSHGVLWTVLSQTDFGNNWLLRFAMACLLGGLFVHFLSAKGVAALWLKTVTVLLAAALVGTLAFAGHAIGGEGVEGVVHPAADALHLIAAAAWSARSSGAAADNDWRGCRLARNRAHRDAALFDARHRLRRHAPSHRRGQ